MSAAELEYRKLPKVELHLHLDCSLSFDVVSQIDPRITRASYERDFIAPAKCINLADYLTRAVRGFALMQSERELHLVTADLFNQLVHDNVGYAEIRFAPLLHTQNGLRAEDVVEIVNDAVSGNVLKTGVEARLILCTLRHFNTQQSMQTVELVNRFKGTRVVALDIAGDEAGFPVDAHIAAFEFAAANNIYRTAHAGEARGAESVWETLKYFQPTRIGHGVRSVEDSRLVEHLKSSRIHLEVCPTSNVQTNVVETMAVHPIDAMYRAGVSIGVNTDARTISNVSLADEYRTLRDVFGWEIHHFRQCNLNALSAAFLPKNEKEELGRQLSEAYNEL